MPARRFPLVDALRGLAALAVLGTHTAFFMGADGSGTTLGPYFQRLEVGVTLFFVISGFLLYRPFVAARHARREAPDVGVYAWHRVLRIVPAYWVALTVTLLLVTSASGYGWNTLALFGFAQTYRTETLGGGLVQAWSLCVELSFYAFLPVWAFGLRRLRGGLRTEWLALAGLAFVGVAWKVVVVATTGSGEQVTIGPWLLTLPTFLDQFAVGMGLAVASVQFGERAFGGPRAVAVSWALAGLAFWTASTRIGISDDLFGAWTPAQFLARHGLYLAIAGLLLWPAVLGDGGRIRALLAHRALAWVGVVSYGVFLWNTTVLDQLAGAGFEPFLGLHPYLAWPLAVIPITLGIAALSWYGLERPVMRLGRGHRAHVPRPGDARRAASPRRGTT